MNQLTATGSPRSCLLAKSFTLKPLRSDEPIFELCAVQRRVAAAHARGMHAREACQSLASLALLACCAMAGAEPRVRAVTAAQLPV